VTTTLRDLLSSNEIESIRRPIQSALTFPATSFTDRNFYDLEVEKIYQKHWVAALFESEVADPGDIVPFEICEIPLLAVRGQDGTLRVFHNICPYDGCLAVIDPVKSAASIETPYHGWTYDLEGRLTATPYWDGSKEGNLDALKGRQVDLVPVACAVFMKTMFVNLSEKPQAFEEYVAPLMRAMDEYDLEGSRPGLDENGQVFVRSHAVNTNWKTYFENACINVLHENFVHTLYRASPEVPRIVGDGIASYVNIIDENFLALGYKRRDFLQTYPPVAIPHLGKDPDVEPENETFGTLYPNFYVSASSQFIEVGIVLPDGPERTTQKATYHFQKDVAASGEALEGRQMVADGFFGAAKEDGRICEAVQKGRKSPVYKQKFYSPFWDKMHHYFSNLILNDLDTD